MRRAKCRDSSDITATLHHPTTDEYISQLGRVGEFEIRVRDNVLEEFGLKFHLGYSTRSILLPFTTLSALHTESTLYSLQPLIMVVWILIYASTLSPAPCVNHATRLLRHHSIQRIGSSGLHAQHLQQCKVRLMGSSLSYNEINEMLQQTFSISCATM